MSDFILILWGIDVLSYLKITSEGLIIGSIVAFIVSHVVYFISDDLNRYTWEEKEVRKNRLSFVNKSAVIVSIVSMLVGAVIPTPSTMEKMAIVYAADVALELDSTQKALDGMGELAVKGSSALNKLLDTYLETPVEGE